MSNERNGSNRYKRWEIRLGFATLILTMCGLIFATVIQIKTLKLASASLEKQVEALNASNVTEFNRLYTNARMALAKAKGKRHEEEAAFWLLVSINELALKMTEDGFLAETHRSFFEDSYVATTLDFISVALCKTHAGKPLAPELEPLGYVRSAKFAEERNMLIRECDE